jgi:hypothetical protein
LRKNRFLASVLLAASAAGGIALAAACGSDDASSPATPAPSDASLDIHPVGPPDAADDHVTPPPTPETSCDSYCRAVMMACHDAEAQYANPGECSAYCQRLDLGDAGDTKSGTIACRAYYATTAAMIDPAKYCAAAGPYGAMLCGDRCSAFCEVTLETCAPDSGSAPFGSFPDCRDACNQLAFKDAGEDGGGEGPTGPTSGNTLNCREHLLRNVLATGEGCADLGVDSGPCR